MEYELGEELQIDYTIAIGIGVNSVLKKISTGGLQSELSAVYSRMIREWLTRLVR